jgi:hypothetical protein
VHTISTKSPLDAVFSPGRRKGLEHFRDGLNHLRDLIPNNSHLQGVKKKPLFWFHEIEMANRVQARKIRGIDESISGKNRGKSL